MSKRNRRKAPVPHPIGFVTLDQWRSNAGNLEWMTADPRVRQLVSVAIITRQNALGFAPVPPGTSFTLEELGIFNLGYEACLNVLAAAAMGIEAPPQDRVEEEYPEPGRPINEPASTD